MTCIAWDGKTLAADKASTCAGLRLTTTKIFKVYGRLLAFSGDADDAMQLLAWFKAGCDPATYPKALEKNDTAGYVFDGDVVLKYTKSPHAERIEDKVFAAGCGRDYALATMHLGFDARRAVEVACHFDSGCGNGIDTLTL